MVVVGGVIDLVDSVNYIDDILHRNGLVGAQHHCGLGVVANRTIDEVEQLGLVGSGLVDVVLELVVDINCDGLLGHGLAIARRQHEFDGVGRDQGGSQHEENQQQKHQIRHGRGVERGFDLIS